MISMDGFDPKPDQKINKKKARELIDLVDKVVIANYDCPRGNDGITIPISPMDWIKQNYDFYCEVYSKAKLTPKLIMVPQRLSRPFLSTATSWLCTASTTQSKGSRCFRSWRRRSRPGWAGTSRSSSAWSTSIRWSTSTSPACTSSTPASATSSRSEWESAPLKSAQGWRSSCKCSEYLILPFFGIAAMNKSPVRQVDALVDDRRVGGDLPGVDRAHLKH